MSPNVAGMATPEQTYRRLAVIRPSVNVDTLKDGRGGEKS
jgi:hypothetical protein